MTDGLSKLTGWDIGSVGVGRGEGVARAWRSASDLRAASVRT
jgi:hypothetical protein